MHEQGKKGTEGLCSSLAAASEREGQSLAAPLESNGWGYISLTNVERIRNCNTKKTTRREI